MKKTLTIAMMLASCASCHAGLAEPWLAAYVHMPQCFPASGAQEEREASIGAALDDMKRSGLRIILPYVSTSAGEAHYPSTVIAKRAYGEWDPLGVFVREARARGLEVWPAVPMLISGHDAPKGILAEHPDWALRDAKGQATGYISPGAAGAREWLVSVIDEIVTRYQPDGLLLDYLRYPNQPVDFDAETRARFLQETGREDYDIRDRKDVQLQAFKEECLTELMGAIHKQLQETRPQVKIGLYTWGAHVSREHYVAQNWPEWVRRGYLDVVNVSGYCYPKNYGDAYLDEFRKRCRDAVACVEHVERHPVMTFALGVKTSHGEVTSAQEIGVYMKPAREEGMDGLAVFTLSYLRPYLDAFIEGDSLREFAPAGSRP